MRISDWSSDVCSSDLEVMSNFSHRGRWKRMIDFSGPYGRSGELHRISVEIPLAPDSGHVDVQAAHTAFVPSAQSLGLLAGGDIRLLGPHLTPPAYPQIGRASGRERVCLYGESSVAAA